MDSPLRFSVFPMSLGKNRIKLFFRMEQSGITIGRTATIAITYVVVAPIRPVMLFLPPPVILSDALRTHYNGSPCGYLSVSPNCAKHTLRFKNG